MMNKVKAFFSRMGNKARYAAAMLGVGSVAAMSTIVASAEETTTDLSTYSTQIIQHFTDAADDIVPIVVGVMGAGLVVFAIFAGIKLAKKMFSTVSK